MTPEPKPEYQRADDGRPPQWPVLPVALDQDDFLPERRLVLTRSLAEDEIVSVGEITLPAEVDLPDDVNVGHIIRLRGPASLEAGTAVLIATSTGSSDRGGVRVAALVADVAVANSRSTYLFLSETNELFPVERVPRDLTLNVPQGIVASSVAESLVRADSSTRESAAALPAPRGDHLLVVKSAPALRVTARETSWTFACNWDDMSPISEVAGRIVRLRGRLSFGVGDTLRVADSNGRTLHRCAIVVAPIILKHWWSGTRVFISEEGKIAEIVDAPRASAKVAVSGHVSK